MIDLDRNLTDESYDLSEDGMDEVIKAVKDKGILFVLIQVDQREDSVIGEVG